MNVLQFTIYHSFNVHGVIYVDADGNYALASPTRVLNFTSQIPWHLLSGRSAPLLLVSQQ